MRSAIRRSAGGSAPATASCVPNARRVGSRSRKSRLEVRRKSPPPRIGGGAAPRARCPISDKRVSASHSQGAGRSTTSTRSSASLAPIVNRPPCARTISSATRSSIECGSGPSASDARRRVAEAQQHAHEGSARSAAVVTARRDVEIAALRHDRERLVEQRLEREAQLRRIGDRGRPARVELLQHEVVALPERLAPLVEQAADHLRHVDLVSARRIERRELLEPREQSVNPADVLAHHLREARAEAPDRRSARARGRRTCASSTADCEPDESVRSRAGAARGRPRGVRAVALGSRRVDRRWHPAVPLCRAPPHRLRRAACRPTRRRPARARRPPSTRSSVASGLREDDASDCSTTVSSSRTLPGHGYSRRNASAPG